MLWCRYQALREAQDRVMAMVFWHIIEVSPVDSEEEVEARMRSAHGQPELVDLHEQYLLLRRAPGNHHDYLFWFSVLYPRP